MPRKKTEEEKLAVAIVPPRLRFAKAPNLNFLYPPTHQPITGNANPYEIRPEGIQFIHDEAQRGSTLGAIANGLGIDPRTFQELRKRDDRCQQAFNIGRANIVTRLSHVLVNKALEGNTVELLFALKTIGGFREGTPSEGAPTVNVNISIPAPMSAADAMRIVGRVDTTDLEPVEE